MSIQTERKKETEQSARETKIQHEHSISEAVVAAVARAEAVDPDELRSPLYDSLDPDALDKLYETASERNTTLHLNFTFDGYNISIDSEGEITVHEPNSDTSHER